MSRSAAILAWKQARKRAQLPDRKYAYQRDQKPDSLRDQAQVPAQQARAARPESSPSAAHSDLSTPAPRSRRPGLLGGAPRLRRLSVWAPALVGLALALSAHRLFAQESSPKHPAKTHAKPGAKSTAKGKSSGKAAAARGRSAARSAARSAKSVKLKQAFVASTELRPMAQQLSATRTAAAYAGVLAYARQHQGEAAAAAYLALGHAYLLDNHFNEAAANFRQARAAGDALADYAEYLGAKAQHDAGNDAAAEELLKGFSARNPDSIFNAQAPELEAQVLLGLHDLDGARRVLAANPGSAGRAGYQLAQAEVNQASGQTAEAGRQYIHLLLNSPLSFEAQTARSRLTALGLETTLTPAELRSLGDAYYAAGRYAEAAEQYKALARQSGSDASQRNGFAVAAAACDLKLKRLTKQEAEALTPSKDENGARRLYLLMELAREKDDTTAQQTYVDLLRSEFPHSPWLAEALFSSGNMYLLRKDYPRAVAYYSELAEQFPQNSNAAAAHWRAGWWSYRQGLYPQAAKIFEEQIKLYPGAKETVSALYWRARLYEQQDHEPAMAAAHYKTLINTYSHYFYAQMAKERMAALGAATPAIAPALEKYVPAEIPKLETTVPDGDPHLVKAHLLVNAGLTEYVPQEIAATPGSSSWSAIAEAEIYNSYGETFRAMRVLKRALPYAASAQIKSIPLPYWRILFPEVYWDTIRSEAARYNLDPYLVASLIRQESEFNPGAISKANAYGLMQLLPSVGKQMAREEGLGSIDTRQLLDPVMNIRLGTRYLRQMLDRFGGVTEYALAAYNAGDYRVSDWQAAGPYHGIDEFVESIPFTETREYVQGILRNQDIYKAIDQYAGAARPAQRAQAGHSGASTAQPATLGELQLQGSSAR
jgi:soluble lytic murein transglycosylase